MGFFDRNYHVSQHAGHHYRKIITHRGTFFVPWSPREVSSLLASEQFTPGELDPGNDSYLHLFIRDLYLLACRASVAIRDGQDARGHRILIRYARDLHTIYQNRNHEE